MTTTRYKLPDWLGGHEVDVHGQRGDGQLIVTPRGIGPTGVNPTEIHIDRNELTEVAPPEPPIGSVVLDQGGDAWQRGPGADLPWTGGHGGRCSCAHELPSTCADRAAAAPELPWKLGADAEEFTVYKPTGRDGSIQLALGDTYEDLSLIHI